MVGRLSGYISKGEWLSEEEIIGRFDILLMRYTF